MFFQQQQQQKVFGTIKGLLYTACHSYQESTQTPAIFNFFYDKKGEIKIQTKHKYTYRTNTKQKLAFSCNIFRLFALLLTKTCLRSHWHVHDCDHMLNGDHAHDMFNTFFARF